MTLLEIDSSKYTVLQLTNETYFKLPLFCFLLLLFVCCCCYTLTLEIVINVNNVH